MLVRYAARSLASWLPVKQSFKREVGGGGDWYDWEIVSSERDRLGWHVVLATAAPNTCGLGKIGSALGKGVQSWGYVDIQSI